MKNFVRLGITVFLPGAMLVTSLARAQPTAVAPKIQKPATPIPPAPPTVTLLEDIKFGNAGGIPLYLHLALPKDTQGKALPVIVIVHGGGWSGGDRNSNLLGTYKFAENGFASASIEYRLTQQAPFPAQIQDCKCAIRYLRANAAKHHLDPDHIGVLGDSAGGHLVALMGLTESVADFEGDGGWNNVPSRVQAVCDMFGPTDMVAMLYDPNRKLPVEEDKGMARFLGGPVFDNLTKLRWASPLAHVQDSVNTPPFLILHGDKDPHVPLQQSLWLADALQKKGVDVTLRIQINGEHGGPYFFPNALPDMLAFFDRTLKTKQDAKPIRREGGK